MIDEYIKKKLKNKINLNKKLSLGGYTWTIL